MVISTVTAGAATSPMPSSDITRVCSGMMCQWDCTAELKGWNIMVRRLVRTKSVSLITVVWNVPLEWFVSQFRLRVLVLATEPGREEQRLASGVGRRRTDRHG